MSIIAVGATAAVGATVTAGTVATGVALAGAGLTAYNSMSAGNAANAQQQAAQGVGIIDPRTVAATLSGLKKINILKEARKAADFNFNTGVPLADRAASKINSSTVDDVMNAMGRMYGSPSALKQAQDTINTNVQNELEGKVSQSTQDQLGRSLLTQGMTDLGPGAMGANMAGYLGLTQESLQAQGAQQYQSMRAGYRAELPLTTGAQLLPNFTLSPENAVQAAINKETSIAQLQQAGLGMGYQSQYNQGMMQMQQAQQQNLNNQALAGSIAKGVGALSGTLATPSQPYSAATIQAPAAYTQITGAGSGYMSGAGMPLPAGNSYSYAP